jgi:tetratricopeptide (TPR) repeat protein
MQDWKQAMTDLDRALHLDPNIAFAYNNRGWARYELNKNDDAALTDLNKAIEMDPKMPEAYMNRGILYYLLDKRDLAIADFKKVLELTQDPVMVDHAKKNITIASSGGGYVLYR